MEQLFEFLPVLFIVLYVIKKIIEGFKDLELETPQSGNDYSDDYKRDEKNYSEEKVQQKIEDNLQNYEGYTERKKESLKEKQKTEEELKQKKFSAEKKKKQREEKQKKRKKRKQKHRDLVSPSQKGESTLDSVIGKEIKNKDVVKGVIFKEILDDPRAKKPYQPVYKKNKNK